MRVNGSETRTIWVSKDDPNVVHVIDQRCLPHQFSVVELRTLNDACTAIREMTVRGAGLIGACAAFGMYLATLGATDNELTCTLQRAAEDLKSTRPTANNLSWAVHRMLDELLAAKSPAECRIAALNAAQSIADEDAAYCARIGQHGLPLLESMAQAKNGEPLNILTHCNAGWLAFVDTGSATAPIYAAHNAGIPIHIWVDETRPRNQGASLTAWELGQQGVPHTLIADNAGGHLMQHGQVDLVITGADRVTRQGDVANKIGTYLKALAAHDNGIPFFVALPSSTFDFSLTNGLYGVPIEERDSDEVRWIQGLDDTGTLRNVRICPSSTPARNWGFDVTPARLVTLLLCERGVCNASEAGILELFPEHR